MKPINVICADGVSVTLRLSEEITPAHSSLQRMQSAFGIMPDDVLQELLQDFKSVNVVNDMEPSQLGFMVLAFESGLLHTGKLIEGTTH